MKQQRPILHGRDHANGGPDPIPGLGEGGGALEWEDVGASGGLIVPTGLAFQVITGKGYYQMAGAQWTINWSAATANFGSASVFSVITDAGVPKLSFDADAFFLCGTRFGNANTDRFDFISGSQAPPLAGMVAQFPGNNYSFAASVIHPSTANVIVAANIETTDSLNPDGGLGWAGGWSLLAIALGRLT